MGSTLLVGGTVLPIEPQRTIARGWVRLTGDRIDSLGEGDPEPRPGDDVVDATGCIVLPGLVNAHLHSLDSLLRGGVERGTGFLDWLLDVYYGAIVHYAPEDAGVASMLAGAEALRSGTTCVVDNWGVACGLSSGYVLDCARASLDAYRALGLRVVLGRMFATRLPSAWSEHAFRFDPALLTAPLDRCLDETRVIASETAGDPLTTVTPSPELVSMVGVEGMLAAAALAAELGAVMPTHLLTSASDGGAPPLAARGLLDGRVLAAHCTAATDHDLQVLAQYEVAVAHCPTANLAGGTAVPVRRFTDAGLRVGLGTDNPSLAHHLDVIVEARQAALNARLLEPDRDAMTGSAALRLATLGGAEAIGLADRIGSLTPGKQADVLVLDATGPEWLPAADPADTLLRIGRATRVRDVIVAGRRVVAGGRVVALDADHGFADRVRRRTDGLLARAGLRPAGARPLAAAFHPAD